MVSVKSVKSVLVLVCVGMVLGQPEPLPLPTVSTVNLTAYSGLWYQIAGIPQFYEIICDRCTTAEYTVLNESTIGIVNTASSRFGYLSICKITGTATIPDLNEPAKLKVQFSSFPTPPADYWIVELGEINAAGKYSWAIVSGPERRSLFLLAREREIDEQLYSDLMAKIKSYGFDLADIVKTNQNSRCR